MYHSVLQTWLCRIAQGFPHDIGKLESVLAGPVLQGQLETPNI